MKNIIIRNNTTLIVNKSTEGERIEQKIERIVTLNEPIKDGAPLIYTDRKDGVRPEFDVRTDRFEIAIDAMDVANKAKIAQREHKYKEKVDSTKTVTEVSLEESTK